MKKRRNRLTLSEDEKSNLGCLAIILAVVIFVIVYVIIKGFSLWNAIEGFVIAESTFTLICGVALGLIAIPGLVFVYYGVCNYLTPVDKSERWIKPFLNATFFALLYGLFRLVYDLFFPLIWERLGLEELSAFAYFIISFIIFDLFVLIGCLYARKHPDYTITSFVD